MATSPAQGIGPPPPPAPDRPRTLVATWAKAIGGLAAARALALVEPTGLLAANLAGVAALLFVVLADARLRARGEPWSAYGLPRPSPPSSSTLGPYLKGLLAGIASCAVVFPLFGLAFAAWTFLLQPHLPAGLAALLTPYPAPGHPALRFPPGLAMRAVLQLLVVALPEELFYRGYVQTSWARGAPGRGVRLLGARLGAGFLWTQLLFAAGHLVLLQPWRLATFLPGLWFGWLRERTGGLAAPVVAHALSNLFLQVLEASLYGG